MIEDVPLGYNSSIGPQTLRDLNMIERSVENNIIEESAPSKQRIDRNESVTSLNRKLPEE